MKSEWIDKDDIWGIRTALKEIYFHGKYKKVENFFLFDAWVNQQLPPPFYTSKSTIIRHYDEISDPKYRMGGVWIVRGGQFQCGVGDIMENPELKRQLKLKMIRLPLYYEIQAELNRIQELPQYDKRKGVTNPIKEEYVQLVIKKK